MSHKRSSRLTAAAETHFSMSNRRGQAAWLRQTSSLAEEWSLLLTEPQKMEDMYV